MQSSNAVQEGYSRQLMSLSLRLRGIAFLIESQRPDVDPPVDLQDIHWGVGALLTELSRAIAAVGDQLQNEPKKEPPTR